MAAPSIAFVQQYKDTVSMLAQQSDSRASDCVMVDYDFRGDRKFYNQYGSDDFIEIMTRYADTPIMVPDHRLRMVTPRYFVSNTLEDPLDALQMLVDPKSVYMQAKRAAANRQKDDIIISAMGGTAYAGAAGGTATVFDVNQKVAVTYGGGGSNTGLTKAKVLRAATLLNLAEVDNEDRCAVIGAKQLEDLLNTTEVTSSDYNTVKALVQGEVNTWVGFRFKRSERLLTNASGFRLCYFWQKKAIQLAVMKEAEGRITERADKNYAWQVYMRLVMGATRLEESRIVEVACAEA